MTHSYRLHFFHLIWSTKDRTPFIVSEIREDLYSYMGGILRNQTAKLLEIGGMPDHVHLLIELSTLDEFTSCIRKIKANSTLWIHKNFPKLKNFSWQKGYASFSVN